MSSLPTTLPTPAELAANPRAVRGLKVVSSAWVTNDGAVLVRGNWNYRPPRPQWVAYYQVVFERDETNDEPVVDTTIKS